MLKRSAALLVWAPTANADDPATDDASAQQQEDQKKRQEENQDNPGASIAKDILDKGRQAANAAGQQPGTGGRPDSKSGGGYSGGGWMLVNGVVTCVPNGAVFHNGEHLESYLSPNGDPRC